MPRILKAPFAALALTVTALACSGGKETNPMPDGGTPDDGMGGGAPDAETCSFDAGTIEPIATPPIHTPRWAFEPWISKDISARDDTFAFVQGFADHDIPVGVVVLDSPWE